MTEADRAGDRIERTIEVQGIATHLFEAGPPTAPPLLYLHGTHLGNLWLDHHRLLAQQFHLFAPDIPGFGLSERPDWMHDMSDYVLYFRDLMAALGLERAALVGHSLGGWMAAEIAVWYPERVSRLVLSNAAGLRVKGVPMADIFALSPQRLLETCFENLMAAAPLIPREINTDYFVRLYAERTTLAALAWNPHYDPKLARRLQQLSCPTLIVWGARDRLIPPAYGQEWQRLIPGAQLVMLEGTGHMPMFEVCEQWVAHVSAFLQPSQPQEVKSS
ncbi:hydrolase [Thermogemmatispora aurantia]|uniref:Hydrolase n=1 Tax=Thermogemmatispora aurantia TaxID=2045279 RepID=A0A5J4KB49_9CHLR|nr:alpha/beta fold hydrolase [Thermogemmatispora aurantia]GER85768.1 hydrolase [Thermogemmatispora aurantia]